MTVVAPTPAPPPTRRAHLSVAAQSEAPIQAHMTRLGFGSVAVYRL